MKKFVSMLLVLLIICTVSASAFAATWNLEGTMFPLDEPVTFTILTSGYRYASLSELANNKDWQSLCEATNVNFEFVSLGDYDAPEARTNLQMRLMNEDYADGIICVYINTLSQSDIQELATSGILIPIDEYLSNPEIMPNFYENVYTKLPDIVNNMRSVDGNIYAFQGVDQLASYTSGEALLQVNEAWMNAWMEARGIDHSPATLDEFEDMLIFFRDSDLNGNGQNDEIPYMIAQEAYQGTATLEHAMGMFGVATKDSALDMNIMIDDDQCYFVHTTEKYKAALKTFASWYQQKLIWEEIFTGNAETINSQFAMASNVIGVTNTSNELEGFVTILPPEIDGYEPRYHMHPALRLGVGQPFGVISNKCEHPEILAAFWDLMYDFDNNLLWRYGSEKIDNDLTINAEGKYDFTNLDRTTPLKGEVDDSIRAIFDFIWYASVNTQENFNNRVDIDSFFGDKSNIKGHQMFTENGIWNPTECIWPRCSIPEEYAEEYAFLYTDVSAVLTEYRAKFITGQLDVDAEWDNFQQKMKDLGIEEMQEIIQIAYDAYLNK